MNEPTICAVDGTPVRRLGRCRDLRAQHYICGEGHEMCGFEGFWRKDGKAFCRKCGTEMIFRKSYWERGLFIYGWICPKCSSAPGEEEA